jgi:effector-binding domain-containing protein
MEDEETIPDYVARVKAFVEKKSKDRIVARCALYFQEMMEVAWHPSRVEQWMLAGVDMEDM